MTAPVLASYNLKGGVGKTTAAVNLAYAAAADGLSVLLWDLDPQGAATWLFRVRQRVRGGGKALIRGRRGLDAGIKATNYPGLDLMPADFSYRKLDRHLARGDFGTERLAELLAPVRSSHDVVILDCPPAITELSENIFSAADALLIPLLPTALSVRVYVQLKAWLRGREHFKVRLLPCFSMVDGRRRSHRELMHAVRRDHPEVLDTVINQSAVVERMASERAPLQVCAPRHPVSDSFTALWRETRARITHDLPENKPIADGIPPA